MIILFRASSPYVMVKSIVSVAHLILHYGEVNGHLAKKPTLPLASRIVSNRALASRLLLAEARRLF